jgi:hypothetical protein
LESGDKLILNNLYGKTIQKPIDDKLVFIEGEEQVKMYKNKNYEKIIDCSYVGGNKTCFKVSKPINDYFNNVLLGSHVLAMSKRIMNEVMCLGEDIGCKMFYQDTDSFFIIKDDLAKLESMFETMYGRKLSGKDLGQFHPDFSSRDGRDDVVCAKECLFIRKKLYCCKLLMSDNTENITYRAKGTTDLAIEYAAKEKYPDLNLVDAIFQLYKDIYNGEIIETDLCIGKPQFKINKNFTVESLTEFKRVISRDKETLTEWQKKKLTRAKQK